MEIILIILIVLVILGIAGIFIVLKKREEKGPGESMSMIQSQLNEMRNQMQDFSEKMVKINETNKQVMNSTEKLEELQNILKNPKQRGAVGEYYLETVLGNVLPENSYEMQYGFEDGTIVDAVVKTKDKIVPVDSKFSLENYNRLIKSNNDEEREKLQKKVRKDLKKRIKETSKYIKPEEGTTEFAFMFIPSEALYYDLLVHKVGTIDERDLIEEATGKNNVVIVSPTSFLAYLQTVLQGLRAFQIEESAKDIKKWVRGLSRHLKAFEKNIDKLGKHLRTVFRSFNDANKEFKKIDKDIDRITGEKMGTDIEELEIPQEDE
ncbi:MAG TPA: DNA recombination protein RmuC [Candidatus Paceibacterota bacterium]|nr:DNA recombination protein RmuC [Candidatus Paceibacterota bacterium]